MAKETIDKKLHERKLKNPPKAIYNILGRVWAILYNKRLNVHVTDNIGIKDIKDNFIVVSNHASRLDYIYVGIPFLPHTLNFVSGYNEFFRSHLAGILRFLQVIPKKNFTADIYTVKEVSRILRNGGNVMIFPEGMSSISGSNQPVALGSGKFIKHFGLPVYYCKISGGYLTNTKYNLEERPGRVDVVIDKLFDPEDLKSMTADDVDNKLNEVLYHDDYEWNKTARVAFKSKEGIANNMEDLLFRCPRCGKEFSMVGKGDKIYCTECGNGAHVNEYYDLIPFDDTCVIPETPKVWFDEERKIVKKEVENEDFLMEEEIELAELPKYSMIKKQDTGIVTGKGVLKLNRSGLSFEGERVGRPFTFHIDPKNLPTYGMCTDVNFFYTFVDGEYFELRPKYRHTAKWLLATEEIHRLCGGKWQNYYENK